MATPKLPIPSLESALSTYEKWVAPLLTEEQQTQLQADIQQFKTNEGLELDQKLHSYVDQLPQNENWMAPFWTKMYLSIHDSLYTESNYALHLGSPSTSENLKSTNYMAHWIIKSALYYQQIYHTPLSTHTEGAFEFCTNNANNLFGKARIPAMPEDQWVHYNEFLTDIVITHNNTYYQITLFDENGKIISNAKLSEYLDAIINSSDKEDTTFISSAYAGSVTAYRFLEDFLKDPTNQQSFEAFNKTIFHVYLPNKEFSQYSDGFQELIANPQHPLWAYTPVNFVLWNNENISVFMEHTGADGTSMTYNLQEIKKNFESPVEQSHYGTEYQPYSILKFHYTDLQRQQLKEYQQDFQKVCENYGFKAYSHTFNEGVLDNISKDSLAQLMFQYGMAGFLKTPKSIYCSCAMNHFQDGRTEALRSVSKESWDFVTDMFARKAIDPQKLASAAQEYKSRIKLSKQGLSFPRYLSGLSWMREDSTQAAYFFNSEALKLINENFFSTSNIGNIGGVADGFYFTPPCPSVFGVGYQTSKNSINFFITYLKKHQDQMDTLIKQFDEFIKIVD